MFLLNLGFFLVPDFNFLMSIYRLSARLPLRSGLRFLQFQRLVHAPSSCVQRTENFYSLPFQSPKALASTYVA
jgi:hypothetical protein